MLARMLLLAAFALALLAATAGCNEPHLAGTNDAEMDYVYDVDPQTGARYAPKVVADGVKYRLSSALIAADVEPTEDGVRVVVDADVTGVVANLVEWRGGLRVQRAVHEQADAPPIVDAAAAATQPADHGRALEVTWPDSARAALEKEQREHPGEHVAIVRGHVTLATMPIEDALSRPLVVRFGDDVVSYTRARTNMRLLQSPILPPMHRASASRLPARWGLGVACAVLPLVLSLAWLAFVRRFDRARPEPLWLVGTTFLLGGVAIVPAALMEIGCAKLTPWLDPSIATLGGQLFALPLALAVFTLVVGIAEEGSKALAAWSLARHRREFDEPVDGIVYGCAAALGFAAVENIKYFAIGRMSGVVIGIRAFMTLPAHMFFGAIWGYAMGRKLVSRKTSVLGFFALAALAHGSFDALLSIDGTQHLATLLVFGLAVAFVIMLQRALRHGAVAPAAAADEPPATEAVPASQLPRAYFRVGSGAAFWACAAGMVVSAFAVMVIGTGYEVAHHRAELVFVTLATATLSLFGLAAWGASATIPLDVAIDARGITFAGACTPWRAITSFDFEPRGMRGYVRLHTADGVVRLGPASVPVAREIYAALAARRVTG